MFTIHMSLLGHIGQEMSMNVRNDDEWLLIMRTILWSSNVAGWKIFDQLSMEGF